MDLSKMVSIGDLCRLAAFLRSEDGENPEYDRALLELIADAACVSMERLSEVDAMCR